MSPDFLPNALKHLEDIDSYARGAVCRHQGAGAVFRPKLPEPSCGACDLCLGDVEVVADADATVIAQKILSCVARVKERFGVNHVISVLRGEDNDRMRQYQHDQLSTFAIMKDHPKTVIRDWIFQLIGQGMLVKSDDEYPVLKLNLASWEVMKGKQKVQLVQPVRRKKARRSNNRAPMRFPGKTWTAAFSRRCVRGVSTGPSSPANRRTSSSATPPCANCRVSDPRHCPTCCWFTASAARRSSNSAKRCCKPSRNIARTRS